MLTEFHLILSPRRRTPRQQSGAAWQRFTFECSNRRCNNNRPHNNGRHRNIGIRSACNSRHWFRRCHPGSRNCRRRSRASSCIPRCKPRRRCNIATPSDNTGCPPSTRHNRHRIAGRAQRRPGPCSRPPMSRQGRAHSKQDEMPTSRGGRPRVGTSSRPSSSVFSAYPPPTSFPHRCMLAVNSARVAAYTWPTRARADHDHHRCRSESGRRDVRTAPR